MRRPHIKGYSVLGSISGPLRYGNDHIRQTSVSVLIGDFDFGFKYSYIQSKSPGRAFRGGVLDFQDFVLAPQVEH